MAQYLSHALIHAHLPPPPSIPHSIPSLSLCDDTDFLSSPSATEPHSIEHATSFSHERDTNVLARVLHNGFVLELRALDTVLGTADQATSGSQTVRIVFPERILPLAEDSIVNSLHDQRIYVFAYTESNALYRLTFPMTSPTGRGTRKSFTTEGNSEWAERYELPADIVSASGGVSTWAAIDEVTVVLGCRDGGIVRLIRSTDDYPDWSATHHRTHSRFRGFFSSSSSSEQVISLARFETQDAILLYALSRDRKLRVWNAQTGSALKTIDVKLSSSEEVAIRSSAASPGPSTPTPEGDNIPSVRVVPHPEPSSRISHLVVVYVASTSSAAPGSFAVYRVAKSPQEVGEITFADEKECNWDSIGLSLRGFEITPPSPRNPASGWRLWATWDSQGSLVAESVLMDDIFQFTTYFESAQSSSLLHEWQRATSDDQVEQYDPAYFDNLLSVDPPNPENTQDNSDIPTVFGDHLFYPGRFSILNLTTALENYIKSLPRGHNYNQFTEKNPSLAEKFAAIVGKNVTAKVNPQTGAPEIQTYRAELKLQWLGIWAAVRNFDVQARWPIGTAKIGEQVLVVTREGVSLPIVQDSGSIVGNADRKGFRVDQFEGLPDGALTEFYPDLVSLLARENSIIISTAGTQLSNTLRKIASVDENGNALDVLIDKVNRYTSQPASDPIEVAAVQLWDEYFAPYLSEDDQEATRGLLSDSANLPSALSDTLQLLSSFDPAFVGQIDENLRFSGLGNALLTAGVASTIMARYKLARGALLVSLFFFAQAQAQSTDDEQCEALVRVLSRVFAIYHRYHVLQWLCEQPADNSHHRKSQQRRAAQRRIGEEEAEGFGTLRSREVEEEETDVDGYPTAYSLLHSLLARGLAQPVAPGPAGLFPSAISSFLSTVSSVSPYLWDTAPTPSDVALAFAVLQDGQPTLAGFLAAMFPPSSALVFIKARAYLDINDIPESVVQFERAASGVKSGSLEQVVPGTSGSTGLTNYYRHVTRLYEENGVHPPIVRFGKLALQSTAPDDPAVKDIWAKVFLSNLSLASYEDAYVTLTSTPYPDVKKDFLGQLISHMCESNQVGRLNSFGFVGLQKDVEELLAFKAKHSDPLRPPNYHRVLYSWHVTRGDYRSAAHVMYNQAKRLEGSHRNSNFTTYDVTVMQARSYLAAINAMSLLDKKQAWIAFPLPPAAFSRAVKRRKVTSYIPESEFAEDKPALEILTLEDIQAEYASVLARLQLVVEIPDILGTGQVSVEPEELVGIFVQKGMYDEALSSAAALKVDMTDLFISLAQRCVQLNRLSEVSADFESPTSSFLYSSPITSNLRGPPEALALRYLQTALERHDSEKTQYKYRIAVSDELFQLNNDAKSGWQIPAWLVEWEMNRDPEGWIARALENGWVSEALGWSLQLLRKETPPELLPSGKSFVACTPYNLFSRVIAATSEGPEKDDKEVQAKVKALKEEVNRRINGLKRIKV